MVYNHIKPSYDTFIKNKRMTILLQEILNSKENQINDKEVNMLLPQINEITKEDKSNNNNNNKERSEIKDINISNFYNYLDRIYIDEIGMSGLNNLNKLYSVENYNEIREYFDENSFELLMKLLKKGLNDSTIKKIVNKKMKKENVLKLIEKKEEEENELDNKIIELIIKENLELEVIKEIVKERSDFNVLLLKECIRNNVNLNELLKEVKNNKQKSIIEIYETISNKKFELFKEIDNKVKIIGGTKKITKTKTDSNNSKNEKKIEIKSKSRKIEKSKSILESEIYNMKIKEESKYNNNNNNNTFSKLNMILSKDDLPQLPSEKEIIGAYRQMNVEHDTMYYRLKNRLEDAEETINRKGGAVTINEEKYLEMIKDKVNLLNYMTAKESDYNALRKEIEGDIHYLMKYMIENDLVIESEEFITKMEEYLAVVEEKRRKEIEVHLTKRREEKIKKREEEEKEEDKVLIIKKERGEGEGEGKKEYVDVNDLLMDPSDLRNNKEILSGKKVFNFESNELNEQLKFGEGFGNDFEILKSDKYDRSVNKKGEFDTLPIYTGFQFVPHDSKYSLEVEPEVHKSYSNLLKSEISAIGRRKTSVAKVTITPGEGKVTVNNTPFIDYFKRPYYRDQICLPFYITYTTGMFDVKCNVRGGGLTGQCDAIKLGISRCLAELESDLTPQLKIAKLLTRDPRMVERKKFGHKKARKSFQWNRR